MIAKSLINLLDNSIGLTKMIVSRLSPGHLKELQNLEMARIELEHKIDTYKKKLPAERVERHLEGWLDEHKKICKQIIVIQTIASRKLRHAFATNGMQYPKDQEASETSN